LLSHSPPLTVAVPLPVRKPIDADPPDTRPPLMLNTPVPSWPMAMSPVYQVPLLTVAVPRLPAK